MQLKTHPPTLPMNLLAHRGRGPWARRLSTGDNLKVVGYPPPLSTRRLPTHGRFTQWGCEVPLLKCPRPPRNG